MKKAPKKVLFLPLIQLRQNILPMDDEPSRGGKFTVSNPTQKIRITPRAMNSSIIANYYYTIKIVKSKAN